MCVPYGPNWPKLQDFCLLSTLTTAERFAKASSSTLGLCFAREMFFDHQRVRLFNNHAGKLPKDDPSVDAKN